MAKGTCAIDGCEGPGYARGWCMMHYTRNLRHGNPLTIVRGERKLCAVDSCDKLARKRGWCDAHYQQWRLRGSPTYRVSRPERLVNSGGYVMVRCPDHPNADSGGRVPEHRLVMEQTLGRRLLPTETVHHRNGDRQDNRPTNLELWSSVHPSGQRIEDKIEWAVELLRFYAPDRLRE